MLVGSCGLVEILVLRFVIPVACTYGEPLCDEVGAWFIYWLPSLWVVVGDERWSFPTNLSRQEHARSTLFQWLIDFCNKYVSSFWLMLSPWIIRTLTLPPVLASLVPCNFRRYHTPTIYLPQNSHHTYLLWHFHSHSEIYCHATSIIIRYMTWSFIVILLCMIVR